ncbi:hypothetical protein BJ508DRAFT_416773 [Ascobolus immersus RN42]|uniref:RNA polymerase Rpb4/RPC9 core domain-containing protein n=1 Tax=Ascobolus immersus RN42 TaxID=1160509 RepID=A0A3N4I835_ASCIM|nr:hypothetical protein BJ508DRAFT_416773 [Ascobolus immersus RN42]
MPLPAPTARAKESAHIDEEAGSTLRLGEFQNVPSLTLSETRELIKAVLQHRVDNNQYQGVGETEVLTKTKEYLDVFSRFKQRESIQAVERILSQQTQLAAFEKSQLGTLCCDSAEEAKTLIPSLQNKLSDDDLQRLLDDITKLRTFIDT